MDFNKAFVMIANFDMLPMQDFYSWVLPFGYQKAYRHNFVEMGMETHNVMFNLGFLFLFFPFFLVFLIILGCVWNCKRIHGTKENVNDLVDPFASLP